MESVRSFLDGPSLDDESRDRFRNSLLKRREALVAAAHGSMPPIVAEIDRALERLGACIACEGGVEEPRLALDFTTSVCLAHYTDEELRDLERDLAFAARVQRDLQPSNVPDVEGWTVSAHARPARIVTGDHLDFLRLRNGNWVVAIADVMGKGVSASLLVANLQASLRILAQEETDIARIVTRVNELFRYNLDVVSFVTLTLVELDGDEVRWCNAGHEPPIVVSGDSTRELGGTGPAIGFDPDATYASRQTRLAPGDRALLFTDGLVETRDGEGETYGSARLRGWLASEESPSLSGLRREVASFGGGDPQDDLTLVMLARHG